MAVGGEVAGVVMGQEVPVDGDNSEDTLQLRPSSDGGCWLRLVSYDQL